MNWLRKTVVSLLCAGAALLALFLVCGCDTVDSPSPTTHHVGGAVTQPPLSTAGTPDLLRVGDAVSITFSGVERPPDKFDGRIRDDGNIILPILPEAVLAAGKTAAQLQDKIHELYVPKYFTRLTVNVNTEGRYFAVEGEVKQPNRYVYSGQLTLLQAVATASGFTDFAKKTQVQVIRTNGKIDIVNCNKAKRNPKLDLPIYPGDLILVPRRLW